MVKIGWKNRKIGINIFKFILKCLMLVFGYEFLQI